MLQHMTCTHQPGKASAAQGSTLRCFHSAKGPAQRRLHLVLARHIYLFLQAPRPEKGGHTKPDHLYFFLLSDNVGRAVCSSVLHHTKMQWSLMSPSEGALRAVKELSRAAKQTPLMKAHTIINRLIYSIQLRKAISKVKWVVNTRHSSKKKKRNL